MNTMQNSPVSGSGKGTTMNHPLRRRSGRILAVGVLAAGSYAAFGSSTGAEAAPPPPVTTTFAHTGDMQSYDVPPGICRVTIVAQGGSGRDFQGGLRLATGGKGAIITATVPVPAGDVLSVLAAGSGDTDSYGGGAAGGGGASVVSTSQPIPLVVAGGGGGGGDGYRGGGGGAGGDAGAIGADAGGLYGTQGGTSTGIGGTGISGSGLGAGAGGGGVNGGGDGGTSFIEPTGSTEAGDGGSGNGVYGGGGGARPAGVATNGGNGGARGQVGSSMGGGAGNTRGGNGFGTSGGGGLGFGGGGNPLGGAGWGAGAGGGRSTGEPGGGGSSHVDASATDVSSALGTGNGSVSISYDPATDACDGTPDNPTGVAATPGIGAASVAFDAPASDGGSAITSYTVTATDQDHRGHGGQTATGSGSPITVDGLYPGDDYTFRVHATNTTGDGIDSADSSAITTADVPGAPSGVAATATGTDAGTAQVSFAAPDDDGGSPITGYSVVAIDGTSAADGGQGRTGTASPIIVTGLTPGDSYTFKVRAINGAGIGADSGLSNPVTPTAPTTPPAAFAISSADNATLKVGVKGTFQVTTVGGSNATFAVVGVLPSGVTINSTGLISGTPKSAGTYQFTLVAVSGLDTAAQSFTLTVNPRR